MNLMICDSVKRPEEDERRVSEATAGHGGRRDLRTRMWRYPFKPHIKVPYRIAATVAVMEMGISEYSVIADAVGLTIEEVERVDMAEDLAVRQLALARIPIGESFKLFCRVRCPRCQAKVALAPCIACRGTKENY
jgi:hypothetical protein